MMIVAAMIVPHGCWNALPDSPTLARRIQDAIKSAATAARPAISNTLLEPPVRTDVEAKAVPGQAVAAPFAAVGLLRHGEVVETPFGPHLLINLPLDRL